MFLCYNIKILFCFSVTISQDFYVFLLQYHIIVMLFCYNVKTLLCFFTISQCRDVFLLQYCNVPMLQIYDILQLVHCQQYVTIQYHNVTTLFCQNMLLRDIVMFSVTYMIYYCNSQLVNYIWFTAHRRLPYHNMVMILCHDIIIMG